MNQNPDQITQILNQREHTHGSFTANAEIYNYLKWVTKGRTTRFESLTDQERLALDMIFGKIARILSPKKETNPDDWHDIQGYAYLAHAFTSENQVPYEPEN